ncbi:hypothetical protein ACFE04_030723 [Oxalis oulophora]
MSTTTTDRSTTQSTPTFTVTRKHHRRLNNPCPSTPKSLPLTRGTLLYNPHSLPNQTFSIGQHFDLIWTNGSLSVSHKSDPFKSMWSTVPGQAFVSGAIVETEVEESRGSFAIIDRDVNLVCAHQVVDEMSVITESDQFPSGFSRVDEEEDKWFKFPALVVSGRIFKARKKFFDFSGVFEDNVIDRNEVSAYAKYLVLFEEKSSCQVGFEVRIGEPEFRSRPVVGRFRRFKRKLKWICRRRLEWWLELCSRSRGFVEIGGENEVGEVSKPKEINRICLTYASEVDEKFYGFGEQFSYMEFKGKRVPIFVQEQGIGRGDQPITFAANLVSHRAGGDWSTTYAPSPFYLTTKMKSVYLEGYDYSIFDLTRHDRVQIQIYGNSARGRILHGSSPSELIEHYTETIGRPPQLPEWIISGAVVGMQGGTEAVRRVWDELKIFDVPISAFWLQDWVGQRETMIGSQLWWNWEVDTTRYSGWRQLVDDLGSQRIKVMTYCNPCLAPTEEKANRRKNLFEEAKKLDILVKDRNGEAYMVPNTAFHVGMLDLTHPITPSWFKKVLEDMVNDDGVRGWMADFGEGLPVDAILYSGEDPISAHNRYPELWAQINREFVDEWKINHPDESLVFFVRAGFRDSPKWGMLFWEGDQMVSWQANDGIKSAVVGLLSSGLSGYAFNHSDIGGYCAVDVPFLKYHRSEELLLRWMELSAFTTVFRTHEGNRPTCNSQFYSNQQTLSHFARCAKIYNAWKFYRIQLIKKAAEKGLPVCRHLFIHYPEDERVHKISYQQFLVGSEILVVPVLDKGKKNVKAYFPSGENCSWIHIWSGEMYKSLGCEDLVEAPIGYPAVFVKDGSIVGRTFVENLKKLDIL